MSVVEEAPTEVQTNGVAPEANAEKSRQEIFRFSEYVHVGEGAAECPERESGKCRDQSHFHAWVRLPNPFQVRDIIEKAQAAKARKIRELRDPQSDAHVILEGELQSIRDSGAKDILIDEIIDADYTDDSVQAVRHVEDEDDPDFVPEDGEEVPKKWANIDQDREEYERQLQFPEDQREGFEALSARLTEYTEAIEERIKAIRERRRQSLEDRDWDELIEMVRKERIEIISGEAYLHTFHTWQWYVCTFKPRQGGTPNERVWKDIAQMKFGEAPEVIMVLREVFDGLESRLGRSRAAKNS